MKRNKKLYDNLVCALVHNIDTCDRCGKCKGDGAAEIRMIMAEQLAKILGVESPWKVEKDYDTK